MLTKSLFQRGESCPKELWLSIHRPDLRSPIGDAVKARAHRNRDAELLVRGLFPDAISVPHWEMGLEEAVEHTHQFIESGVRVLFEASFSAGFLSARIPILERHGSGWHVMLVKAAKEAKPKYVADLAFQTLVMEQAGYPVARATVAHLRKGYQWDGGPYDLGQLFELADVTDQVRELKPGIQERAGQFPALWEATEYPRELGTFPHVDPGLRAVCRTCSYAEHCFEQAPPDHIFYLGLHHTRAKKLKDQGITRISEIPDGVIENPKEIIRFTAHTEGRPQVSPEMRDRLAAIKFPAHLIDFETLQSAVPILPGTRSFDKFPFLWSCHTVNGLDCGTDISIGHSEYLHAEASDPRAAFVRTLLAQIRAGGSIFHYSSFEKTTINELASAGIPGADELVGLFGRFIDLEGFIKDGYVDARFKGQSSMKAVLPVLAPDLSYKGMAIDGGDLAQMKYEETLRPDCAADKRSAIYAALREYCRLDTWAMARVLKHLGEVDSTLLKF